MGFRGVGRVPVGVVVAMVAATTLTLSGRAAAAPPTDDFVADAEHARTGNVIFLHPDGTGLNSWNAARAYWRGPDSVLAWDELPEKAAYRGHMEDVLTGTSNGGATTHAFGYKVDGPGSFGKDGGSDATPPDDRFINSLSGYQGSIMREAANRGRPVGVVNDGIVAEPGTGAFLAEVGSREDTTEISKQMLLGRPGAGDTAPHVILGGGEADFLPRDTPRCPPGGITPECRVHEVTGGEGETTTGERRDGQNLLRTAVDQGYELVRTRAEFAALRAEVERRPDYAPKVLGLFAASDTFNDVPEEQLVANGFVDPAIPGDDRRTNLVLYGDRPGAPGFDPPTIAEMNTLATEILDRVADQRHTNFMLVVEPESTDNFGNQNNAIGHLIGLGRTDTLIAETRGFLADHPDTLLLTAADSDGGGLQAIGFAPGEVPGRVESQGTNPVAADEGPAGQAVAAPLDGLYGRGSPPFQTLPDQFGRALPFAVQWTGTADYAGGILTRAEGRNASLLRRSFSDRFDNVDVYRMMYLTTFGRALPYPEGRPAPTR